MPKQKENPVTPFTVNPRQTQCITIKNIKRPSSRANIKGCISYHPAQRETRVAKNRPLDDASAILTATESGFVRYKSLGHTSSLSLSREIYFRAGVPEKEEAGEPQAAVDSGKQRALSRADVIAALKRKNVGWNGYVCSNVRLKWVERWWRWWRNVD